jgi:undecaprenyl-diphosphatase
MKQLIGRFFKLCGQHKLLIIACIAAIVFVAILEDLLENELLAIDSFAYWLVILHLRTDWLTPIMQSITNLAGPVTILVMLVVVAAFAPGRRPGMYATLNLVLVVILNEALKFIIHRPRPDGYRLISEIGYSFPSGHSMVSMAFYGLLIWMIWRYEKDRTMRLWWSLALALVILGVGFSRIYLGVHYASDVVAGFCVSLIWLAFYTKVVAPLFLSEPVNPPTAGKHLKETVEKLIDSHDAS